MQAKEKGFFQVKSGTNFDIFKTCLEDPDQTCIGECLHIMR